MKRLVERASVPAAVPELGGVSGLEDRVKGIRN
jgi:hypothetical protein